MTDTALELWDFADAPPALRDLIPLSYAGGIVVFVLPGGADEVVDYVVTRWTLMGLSIVRHQREDGSIILAGPNLPPSALPLP